MFKKLKVAGVDLSQYGIVISGDGAFNAAERDVEVISVAGRNGDLTIDNGRYHNIEVRYPVSIAHNFHENAAKLRAFLGSLRGYQRIEDGYSPLTYRLGCFRGTVEYVVGPMCRTGQATLKFDCKPQRYLAAGEFAYEYCESSWIVNPTQEIALPLITVYGSGPGDLSISGNTVQILALEDQITLDSETLNAYRQVGDSPAENRNGNICAPEFPALTPGVNHFSWNGGIERIRIVPRWWTL